MYNVVNTRPTVVRRAAPQHGAQDIQNAAQQLLGFAMEVDARDRAAAEAEAGRAHDVNLAGINNSAAVDRLNLGFKHDDASREDNQSFTTQERLGSETFRRDFQQFVNDFESGEALKQRTWQSGENKLGRDLDRYGIDTGAATTRRGQDMTHSLGMRELDMREKGTYFERAAAGPSLGMRFQPDDLYLSPNNIVQLYNQMGMEENPDNAVSVRAGKILDQVHRQYGGNPLQMPAPTPNTGPAAPPAAAPARKPPEVRARELAQQFGGDVAKVREQMAREGYSVR